MGQGCEYHVESGFYGDFIDSRADEWFPSGWKQRLVPFSGHDNVFAMHPIDAASREARRHGSLPSGQEDGLAAQ